MFMQQITQAIRQMIEISDIELEDFLSRCIEKKFKRYEIVSRPGTIPNEIFFINSGLIRVVVTDNDGVEHSLHFAMENQFIADYSAFILKQASLYTLRAEEETEAVILPRSAIGMGGIIGLDPSSPLDKPWRKQVMNCSSDQLPSPVESGVRFAAYEVPHGPCHAVRS